MYTFGQNVPQLSSALSYVSFQVQGLFAFDIGLRDIKVSKLLPSITRIAATRLLKLLTNIEDSFWLGDLILIPILYSLFFQWPRHIPC